MILYTLWQQDPEEPDGFWNIASTCDACIDEHDGYPPDYRAKRALPGVRELAVKIPDRVIHKLFATPTFDVSDVEIKDSK